MKNTVLLIYTLIVLLIPNILLCHTEEMGLWASMANVLLPGAVILFLLACSPKIGRNIWVTFIFFFFAAFQLVLLSLYGRSVIAVDMFLNLVTTNPGEAGELLGNMGPTLVVVFLLYLPPLILGAISWKKEVSLDAPVLRASRYMALGMLVIGSIGFAGACATPGYAARKSIYPLNVTYNIYLAADRTAKTADYAETSRDFKYNTTSDHPEDARETYIIIVGETSRASNWGLLGYGRNTTPGLSKREGLSAFPQAYSESNTTHKSVPMLLSPVTAETFDKEIYNVKSVITAFKEAGFNTAYLSNQGYNHSFIDFFAREADTTVFLRDKGERFSDLALLEPMNAILAQGSRKQLIVLHTYGSHFNYRDRYEGQRPAFTPDDYTEATKGNRDKLINAYDNTIVLADELIDRCIEGLDSMAGLMGGVIYASDHGEDIFDDASGRFLHASPVPSMQQVHVPMVVWMTDSLRHFSADKTENLALHGPLTVSTSRSFMPTAMDMAGLHSDKVDQASSLLSPKFKEREPVYLNDHNEAVALKEIVR